jgi:hypothetical protein
MRFALPAAGGGAMAWLDWVSYPRLIVNYIYVMFGVFFLSIFAFFFPIMPL